MLFLLVPEEDVTRVDGAITTFDPSNATVQSGLAGSLAVESVPFALSTPGPILTPVAGFALDGITTLSAHSVYRRLYTAYTGPLIRVRRSGDNAEMDIDYDTSTNKLDTAALSDFVTQSGGDPTADGFVTKIYNQNGVVNRNLDQSTAAKQFRIMVGGSLVTINGKAAMQGPSASVEQNMVTTDNYVGSDIDAGAGCTFLAVARATAAPLSSGGSGVANPDLGSNGLFHMAGTEWSTRAGSNNVAIADGGLPATAALASYYKSTSLGIRVNGGALTEQAFAVSSTGARKLAVGGVRNGAATSFKGEISEVICIAGVDTADTTIHDNQITAYEIS